MDTSSFSHNPALLAAAPDTSIGNAPPSAAYPEADRDQAGEAEIGNPPHASDPLDPAGTPSPADPTVQPGLGEPEDELDDVPDGLEDPELAGRAQPAPQTRQARPLSGRDESLEPGLDPGIEDNTPDLSDDLSDELTARGGLPPSPRENAARLTAQSTRHWVQGSSLGAGLLTLMLASALVLVGSLALWTRAQRARVETTDYVNS